jgi:hypothetical protein
MIDFQRRVMARWMQTAMPTKEQIPMGIMKKPPERRNFQTCSLRLGSGIAGRFNK